MPLNLGQVGHEAASRARGRRVTRSPITSHDAKQRARERLMQGTLTSKQEQVIRTLAVAGILTTKQLDRLLVISDRTLRRYHKEHLVDRFRLRVPSLWEAGLLTAPQRGVFCKLGLEGVEVAALLDDHRVPIGYEGFGTHRITHDILANEVLIRVVQAAAEAGWEPIWLNKYEATVHDDAGRPLLEPDAALRLRHPNRSERLFLLEYHNENRRSRAEEKVKRYEEVARGAHWHVTWGIGAAPTLLLCWTHRAVAVGYDEAIQRQAHRHLGLRLRYLGMPIQRLLEGHDPLQWKSFLPKEVRHLLDDDLSR